MRRRKRGPDRKPDAKRRATTRAGQGRLPDLVVIQAKERRIAMTSRADLPVTPLGVLCGRGVIADAVYDAASYYGALLMLWRRGYALADGSAEGLYARMVAGNVDGASGSRVDAIDRPTSADGAQAEIARIEARMTPRQVGLARGIVNGDWPGCIEAMVLTHARFADGKSTVKLPGGAERKLGEIAEALALIARTDRRCMPAIREMTAA